jgi:hypothetical protein
MCHHNCHLYGLVISTVEFCHFIVLINDNLCNKIIFLSQHWSIGGTDDHSDTASEYDDDGLDEERRDRMRKQEIFKERQLSFETSRLERRKLHVSSTSEESVSVIVDCKGALDHIGEVHYFCLRG